MVEQSLNAFIARHSADELIVTAMIYDHAARLKSYDILRTIAGRAA